MKAEDDSDRYSVYWIHLDTEVDPYVDGYVGVTCDIERRFRRHRMHAVLMPDVKKNSWRLYRAFREHGLDRFVFDVFLSNLDKWTAYNVEYALRPWKGIGYNIEHGGFYASRYKCSSLSPLVRRAASVSAA